MDHRSLGSNRQAAADSANAGKELNSKRTHVKYVTHYSSIEKADNLWYTTSACW